MNNKLIGYDYICCNLFYLYYKTKDLWNEKCVIQCNTEEAIKAGVPKKFIIDIMNRNRGFRSYMQNNHPEVIKMFEENY